MSTQTMANNYVDLLRFSGNVGMFEVKLLNRKHCGWSFQKIRLKLKLNVFYRHIYYTNTYKIAVIIMVCH